MHKFRDYFHELIAKPWQPRPLLPPPRLKRKQRSPPLPVAPEVAEVAPDIEDAGDVAVAKGDEVRRHLHLKRPVHVILAKFLSRNC